MNYLVLGAGWMGSAIAFDLARAEGTTSITLADLDGGKAKESAARIGSRQVRHLQLDAGDRSALTRAMDGQHCVLSAASYRLNPAITRAAIDAKVHLCDLGGNDDVVAEQRSLTGEAEAAGVTIVPNCGLAPGMANVLAARGIEMFQSVEKVKIRVGGLPQHPLPPFNYQLVFSVEGLINEYTGTSKVLRNGRVDLVETLTETEPIEFPPPFGTLEAFHTSGGVSILPDLYAGKVQELDYKTIRYPGHCERFKSLLDLGFASHEPITVGTSVMTARDLFLELVKKRLSGNSPDVVLMRVTIEGTKEGTRTTLLFELIDSFDKNDNITAMMRTTAYPTSAIAQLIGEGVIQKRGVLTPEEVVPLEPFLAKLKKSGIRVDQRWV